MPERRDDVHRNMASLDNCEAYPHPGKKTSAVTHPLAANVSPKRRVPGDMAEVFVVVTTQGHQVVRKSMNPIQPVWSP